MWITPEAAQSGEALTVSALNRLVKALLDRGLPLCRVSGEVSNFTRAASGHWYFSLKDSEAQVRCVMFRAKNQWLDWRPEAGDRLQILALPTLFEPRGEFQLAVEQLERAGDGPLHAAFDRLRRELAALGLFDTALKRPLPAFPRCVGVVTSPAAAALQDVLTTLARRLPGTPVVIYPSPVQGLGVGERIAAALAQASARPECDVLILCRGGGSAEDLWCFNAPEVVHAIRASRIPVISGVGHETDFTLADFAADARAPTPTAAAALAVPDRAELGGRLHTLAGRQALAWERAAGSKAQRLDFYARRLTHPGERLRGQGRELAALTRRLRQAWRHRHGEATQRRRQAALRLLHGRRPLDAAHARLEALRGRLHAGTLHTLERSALRLECLAGGVHQLDPHAALARGYAIVTDGRGRVVSAATDVRAGDTLGVRLHQGRLDVRVVGGDG